MSLLEENFDLYEQADRAHRMHGLSFTNWVRYWETHGWVVKTPDWFMMAGHDFEREDAWLCWWFGAKPGTPFDLALPLSIMPYWKPYVSWARVLKDPSDRPQRYYSTDRVLRLSHHRARLHEGLRTRDS